MAASQTTLDPPSIEKMRGKINEQEDSLHCVDPSHSRDHRTRSPAVGKVRAENRSSRQGALCFVFLRGSIRDENSI